MTLKLIGNKAIPNYLALSTDIEDNGTIVGANLIGRVIYLTDTSSWRLILPNLKLIPFSTGNGTAGVEPTYVSGEIGTVDDTTVAITFSEDIIAADYGLGVTIKVNDVLVTIASATRQTNHAIVYYVIPTVVDTDVVTFEYNSVIGGISSETGTVYLNDIDAQTITNNVPAPP